MAQAISKCPDCGSTVSQFAAGCAICGADLVAARQARERRQAMPSVEGARLAPSDHRGGRGPRCIADRLRLRRPAARRANCRPVRLLRPPEGDVVQRNLALVAVAVALIVVILISFLPGTWNLLLPWVDLSGPVATD
jgi:hypothetical protein